MPLEPQAIATSENRKRVNTDNTMIAIGIQKSDIPFPFPHQGLEAYPSIEDIAESPARRGCPDFLAYEADKVF
jgi:hypothetical protein